MTIEVTLIETSPDAGVRVLGRSSEPRLVEAVRRQLVEDLLVPEARNKSRRPSLARRDVHRSNLFLSGADDEEV